MANSSGVVSTVNNKNMKKTNEPKNQEKPKKSHPSTAAMVHAAISALNDRHGSSIPSIMKYIESNFQVDIQKLKVHLKRYMKNAVAQELLIQTKGHGFTGSFKLPPKSKKPKSDTKKGEKKSRKKQNVEVNVNKPKMDNATKKIKSPKTSLKTSTAKPKTKATKKSQEDVPVSKETAAMKNRIPLTPEKNVNENVKSTSKSKKIRSPVAKKTPRPKRMTGTKAVN